VRYGAAGGAATGPLGGTRAGGVRGAQVTTPSGQTYSRASRGGVAVGPGGGVAAGGSTAAATSGPFGAAAGVRRGGVAVRP
jgi:hypothetical protein